MPPISYERCVYAGCSTTTRVHWYLCHKIQNEIEFPCHDKKISDPWPSTYGKHSESALHLHYEGYKRTILSYGKEGERIQL
jgi:hypothetical protein